MVGGFLFFGVCVRACVRVCVCLYIYIFFIYFFWGGGVFVGFFCVFDLFCFRVVVFFPTFHCAIQIIAG